MPEMTVSDVLAVLERAERLGADTDQPEGSRYILISDTLAQGMAVALRRAVQQ